jgi:uncharacterized protein
MKTIKITAGKIALTVELNDSSSAQNLYDALPITGSANTWGDEIYFSIPVAMAQSPDARADMDVGEVAYWAPGKAFCIFFGRTPVSTGSKPKAASPVNPLGKIVGDAAQLKHVEDGETVILSKVN